jgi:multidrug efflux pump subunit AcrA (membrane-fusion protein)
MRWCLAPGHGVADDLNVPGRGLGAYEEQKRSQLAATQAAYNAALKLLTEARVSADHSLQAAQAGVDVAAAQRDAARARLALIKAGATSQQIDMAKARVDQAQAALDEATLVAPFDGTIADVAINPGEIASPGMRLISVADLTQWEVDTDDLTEKEVVGVRLQYTRVHNAGRAARRDTQRAGHVYHTAQHDQKRDVTYTVKVTITDPDPRLRWGMTLQ